MKNELKLDNAEATMAVHWVMAKVNGKWYKADNFKDKTGKVFILSFESKVKMSKILQMLIDADDELPDEKKIPPFNVEPAPKRILQKPSR